MKPATELKPRRDSFRLTEVAAMHGVHPRTIRRMSQRGEFPRLRKLGGLTVVDGQEYEQWRRRRVEV